jgi:hypothetical protein
MSLTYEKMMKQFLKDCPPKHFNEYGFCKHCGWSANYVVSHVEHDPSCKFINKRFNIWRDEDGELVCSKKPKKTKKPKAVVQCQYTFY